VEIKMLYGVVGDLGVELDAGKTYIVGEHCTEKFAKAMHDRGTGAYVPTGTGSQPTPPPVWIQILKEGPGLRIGPDGQPMKDTLKEGAAYCVPFGYAVQAIGDGSAKMIAAPSASSDLPAAAPAGDAPSAKEGGRGRAGAR
jgi:hypothetical protein